MRAALLCATAAAGGSAAAVPSVVLRNAAAVGVEMPAVGLGTGGYGQTPVAPGVYPECWSDGTGPPYGGTPKCADTPIKATVAWLAAGGRRIDSGSSYGNQKALATGIKQSGVPRKELFIVTKTGDSQGLGYNETTKQVDDVLADYSTTYLDLVMLHWPTAPGNSTDPACAPAGTDPGPGGKECRLHSWRALLDVLHAGKARAVGVSNFNVDHLQELIDSGLELPAVNQVPFNPHLFKPQSALLAKCNAHGIVMNGYSPLGIPDWHKYAKEVGTELLLDEPVVKAIGAAHGKTPAQVLINWQWSLGMVTNPRTADPAHMRENLAAYDFNLTDKEAAQLASMPHDSCDYGDWYECCAGSVNRPFSEPSVLHASIPSCG